MSWLPTKLCRHVGGPSYPALWRCWLRQYASCCRGVRRCAQSQGTPCRAPYRRRPCRGAYRACFADLATKADLDQVEHRLAVRIADTMARSSSNEWLSCSFSKIRTQLFAAITGGGGRPKVRTAGDKG